MKKIKDSKGNIEKKSFIPLIKFFSKFFGVIAVYYLLLMIANDSLFDIYLNITAWISSFILNIFGQATSVSGNAIISKTTVLSLSFGCEGTEPIVIFLAGMIAVPIKLRNKWQQMLMGVVLLYLLNFIRITVLFFIQKDAPQNFDSFHTIIFPLVFILFSLICLGIFIQMASKNEIKRV